MVSRLVREDDEEIAGVSMFSSFFSSDTEVEEAAAASLATVGGVGIGVVLLSAITQVGPMGTC